MTLPSASNPPGPDPVRPPPSAPVGTIVLLCVVGFLYVMMMANLSDSSGSDAAGRGLNQAFAALIGFVLWVLLAILLLVAGAKGCMPAAAAIAAVFLLPLSAFAVVVAMGLHEREQAWPLAVPALLPPLIALYALWARLPAIHARLPALATSLVVGAAILLVSAAPLVASWVAARPDPERDAGLAEQETVRRETEQREQQEARARDGAKFARLGPNSSLADYLEFRYGDHSLDVRRAIRQVKSRQTDAIGLLQQGRLQSLSALLEFDVDATPELCQAYAAALTGAARQVDRKMRSDYLSAAIEMEGQLPNIEWLTGEQCDLRAPLALLEANVRTVSDSSRMDKFADTLAKLRR